MFRNPYEIVDNRPPQHIEKKRDVRFPFALPSNSQFPVHEMTLNDRNGYYHSKKMANTPVQNQYLQQYRLADIQNIYRCYQEQEQTRVERGQRERVDTGQIGLNRQWDEAQIINHRNRDQFIDTPVDTRNQSKKMVENIHREPIAKTMPIRFGS